MAVIGFLPVPPVPAVPTSLSNQLRKSHYRSNIHIMQALIDILIGFGQIALVWGVWYAVVRVAGR